MTQPLVLPVLSGDLDCLTAASGSSLRYIDSGTRNPSEALGHWVASQVVAEVRELRWQTGFFSADGLPAFLPVLSALAAADLPVSALIGSNDCETLQAHALTLVSVIGLPRSNARLGIVSYSGSFFHPKVYHFRRNDGSQTAYVGSANLTLQGVTGFHIEAGLLLDTRDGDPPSVLDSIAQAIDGWFSTSRTGLEIVSSSSDVTRLTSAGVLAAAPQPRSPASTGGGAAGTASNRPRLQPLLRFPPMPSGGATPPGVAPAGAASAPAAPTGPAATPLRTTAALASVPQSPPYPPYVLFAPGSTSPTRGRAALSGANLPGGYAGLVLRLNRDSARHWRGGTGTANISIPVPTVGTLRFGIYNGKYVRPRAEFDLQMRYLSGSTSLLAPAAETNIMVYGFAPGETGHGDVRMVVPKPPAANIGAQAASAALPPPNDGDCALLEWPTSADPTLKLTLLDPRSALFAQAQSLWTNASVANQLVGQGACWLPPGVSPVW